LDIGVSRLYQEFNRPGQFDPAHKERIEQVLAQDCLQILDGKNISTLIGSSGSFESFYEMVQRMPFPKTSEAHQLDFNRLNSVLDWTISSTLEERLDNDWIIPLRKDMLPIAAIMVKWVINNSTINEIWISPYSLKEGALMEE
jgi:exopolyphosphatase/guanosine-5'-triphosphate,3'-diphosphate pyrophosphatase